MPFHPPAAVDVAEQQVATFADPYWSLATTFLAAARRRRLPSQRSRASCSPPGSMATFASTRLKTLAMAGAPIRVFVCSRENDGPATTPFQMSEIAPGADRRTDDEILDG